jgi:hypothetical protein
MFCRSDKVKSLKVENFLEQFIKSFIEEKLTQAFFIHSKEKE